MHASRTSVTQAASLALAFAALLAFPRGAGGQSGYVLSDRVLVSTEGLEGTPTVCGPDGQVFIKMGHPGRMAIRSSLDFGRTYGSPIDTQFAEPGEAVACDVTLDHAGRLFYPWIQTGYADSLEDLFVNSSADWGATWRPQAVQVNIEDGWQAFQFQSAAGESGTFHLLFTTHILEEFRYRLWYSRSLDGGISFDEPLLFAPEWSQFGVALSPTAVTISDEGVVNALFIRLLETSPNRHELCSRTSFDGGTTWSEEIRIDPIATEATLWPAQANGPGGLVYVAWIGTRYGPPNRDVFFARSLDHGLTFEEPVRIDTASAPNALPSDLLSMTSDARGNVIVAWIEFGILRVNVSHDGGATWGGDTSLGPARFGGGTMRVAMNESGHAAIFQLKDYPDGTGAAINASRDFGDTWLPEPIRLDEPNKLANTIKGAIDPAGRIYATWVEEWSEGPMVFHESVTRAAYPALAISAVARGDADGVLVIPPEGLFMEYDLTLRNHHPTEPLSGLSVWLEAKLPNGTTVGPVLGPVTVSIAPGTRKRRTLRKGFPGARPDGLWGLVLRTSGPVEEALGVPIIKQ